MVNVYYLEHMASISVSDIILNTFLLKAAMALENDTTAPHSPPSSYAVDKSLLLNII